MTLTSVSRFLSLGQSIPDKKWWLVVFWSPCPLEPTSTSSNKLLSTFAFPWRASIALSALHHSRLLIISSFSKNLKSFRVQWKASTLFHAVSNPRLLDPKLTRQNTKAKENKITEWTVKNTYVGQFRAFSCASRIRWPCCTAQSAACCAESTSSNIAWVDLRKHSKMV